MACGSGNTFSLLKSGWAEIRVRRSAAGSNRKTIYLLLKESFMLNLKKYSSTQYIWHLLTHENPNSQKKKCVSSAGQRKDMVLILDGNLEHVAHARRRKGLFGEIHPICGFTRSNQMS